MNQEELETLFLTHYGQMYKKLSYRSSYPLPNTKPGRNINGGDSVRSFHCCFPLIDRRRFGRKCTQLHAAVRWVHIWKGKHTHRWIASDFMTKRWHLLQEFGLNCVHRCNSVSINDKLHKSVQLGMACEPFLVLQIILVVVIGSWSGFSRVAFHLIYIFHEING